MGRSRLSSLVVCHRYLHCDWLQIEACTKAADQGPIASTAAFLQHVPKDTPYFWGSVNNSKNSMLGMLFADGLSEFGPAIDKLIDLHDPSEDTSADDRFAFALLSELRGRFNSRGLRELGLDLHAPHAIFGLGIYPAFRIELGRRSEVQRMDRPRVGRCWTGELPDEARSRFPNLGGPIRRAA